MVIRQIRYLVSQHNYVILSAFFLLCSTESFCQSFYVSNRNAHSVKLYDATGNYISDIVSAGSGGLAIPQEVLYHPSNLLLVTGRGNGYIKKYNLSTGAYLGNFTSGYFLDNPTKTTIWKDSLIYVSQWGASQNKVVRFDLTTGAYVDEFTSIGVPNGCGHAWDSLGNLYVAQFGTGANGQVLKFDPAGAYIGVFIPNGTILGPVNLWFDAANSLCVEDWTRGKVFRFNGTTGKYQSTMITGLSNAEGFAFDSIGNLYLCDWTSNIIYKYETSSKLTPFIVTGGLMAPNSILIRPSSVLSVNEALLKVEPNLNAFPTPFKTDITIFINISNANEYSILIYDSQGKLVKTLLKNQSLNSGQHIYKWDGKTNGGADLLNGIYFLELSSKEKCQMFKLIKSQ